MKRIKIDILKEEVDLPDNAPYLNVVETNGLNHIIGEGELPSYDVIEKRITYLSQQIYHPETKERILYFVKTDDRKLFNDLLLVSDGFLNSKMIEAVDNWKLENLKGIIMETKWKQTSWIKSLSWWKRLFNKF